MTFLQPFLLWALPLALFPVALHFLNRMRHRSVPWGAMMFLLSATRSSTRNAKLRQFLILACRVLAIAALVLALARPLAQGWWGASVPDAIVLVLDRSASMEQRAGEETLRQAAIRRLMNAARPFEGRSRLVLLESVSRVPQEIGELDVLPQLAITSPTDTASDIPALLKAATEWLADTQAGPAEIWVASDFQSSNWEPNSSRWKNLAAQMSSLPQGVRVRLLELATGGSGADAKVSVMEANRRFQADGGRLDLSIAVESDGSDMSDVSDGDAIPVAIAVDDARFRLDTPSGGSRAVLRHTIDLGSRAESGWGFVELPADANPRNNRAYFVYPPAQTLEAAVVSEDDGIANLLRLASAPAPDRTRRSARIFTPTTADSMPWETLALIVWQAPFPTGSLADRLARFVGEGGTLLFFPPKEAEDQGTWNGVSWKLSEMAEEGSPFRVVQWETEQGPLADSQEDIALPLDEIAATRRRVPTGIETGVLASFEGGDPLLVRREIGRGQVLFASTLPDAAWSNLGDGPVIVPMLQRLFESGAKRLSPHRTVAAGEWIPDDPSAWRSVSSDEPGSLGTDAGVYRSGTEFVAVNRPGREDLPETLGREDGARLFELIPVKWIGDDTGTFKAPEGELWRLLVGAMLLFLMVEGWLSLPDRGKRDVDNARAVGEAVVAR